MRGSKYSHLLKPKPLSRSELKAPVALRQTLDELAPGEHLLLTGADGRKIVVMDHEDFLQLLESQGLQACPRGQRPTD
jgi:hypothetical protein